MFTQSSVRCSARSWARAFTFVLAAAAGLLPVSGCGDDLGATPQVLPPKAKLLVFSDPHYFDPSLGTHGPAFEAYLASDRKLIGESDAIVRAMVANVEAENPTAVLIAGDLTKDGELLSHQSMARYLHQMKSNGRKVFVVPGNHDIENGGAVSYAGDTTTVVPAISAADFATIYADMGYADAIARDPTSLSYVAELVPGLWLLAMDSCTYGEARGSGVTPGRFLDSTKAWIKAQLDAAQARGIRVIGMMHHGVVEHFTNQNLIFSEYLVDDRDAVARMFSDGGMGAVLTGHFHANDITQGKPTGAARSLYDIETGSTVTYPCPYRIIDVDADTLAITTKHVTNIDYDLGNAPDFQTLAHDSLRLGLESLISRLITAAPYSLAPDDAAQIAPWLGDGLVAHYAGDEVMPPDVSVEAQTLLAAPGFTKQLAGAMLISIWNDLPPPDNTVTLDLSQR
jgi:3',5'-cyclic AMP phosphodiesterase CpdA